MDLTLKESLLAACKRADALREIADGRGRPDEKRNVKILSGSLPALLGATLFKGQSHHSLALFPDRESATYHHDDVWEFLSERQVILLPASRARWGQAADRVAVCQRTQVLEALYEAGDPRYIVTYPAALLEKLATPETYREHSLRLKIGDPIQPDALNEALLARGFTRVDFVSQPGEFSLRGGLVDVFSFSDDKPYRIAFSSREISHLLHLCASSQRSEGKLDAVKITPDTTLHTQGDAYRSLLELLPEPSWIFASGLEGFDARLRELYPSTLEASDPGEGGDPKASAHLTPPEALRAQLHKRRVLEFDGPFFTSGASLAWTSAPQPAFNKKFELLGENLVENQKAGLQNFLICSNERQVQRFADIFEDLKIQAPYRAVVGNLHRGFVDYESKIACYTDHQIFNRYHKSRFKSRVSPSQKLTLKALNALQVGDYITHIDHGVGKFAGLKKIQVNGKAQEAIKLLYENDDILYLSIHALHKIARYRSREGQAPKRNKLGSPAWKSLKKKTKRKAKELAFDLIQLYAKRKMQKGFAYAPDTHLQHELEASFLFEDTPDQNRATRAVKADMESEQPMDRLICGDVGFGKTEIAIRAAFKAIADGKQVAVLVPTTILAFQHFRSFSQRLAAFPVNVDYFNRFRTAKCKRTILEKTAQGEIHILIGTHQLISKSLKFKNLGLLIVDEEHKFGVSVKDKLKTLRTNVDTLTLTATPIPRTLQFSLMAARDLSIIKTPPTNRQPIQTERIDFEEEVLRQAMRRELKRGGQIFFINNRIGNLPDIASILQRLLPEARIATGHGQLDGKKLESLLLDFMQGKYDILVSTTIVESGLDIPNANTVFIHHAERFGLADLHQIRGRVGRSNKKAFCYLITPPYAQLKPEARRRLQALEQFSDLGAGFNIAMKDLEIRGAGDILGAEQSGFIAEMGFETYQKILNEAVEEVREREFEDRYKNTGDQVELRSDVQLDTDFEILLPDSYVNSVSERLELYTRLSHLHTRAELDAFQGELTDRFGPLPQQARDLMGSALLKIQAQGLGFQRIVLKNELMLGYFTKREAFFQSEVFSGILQCVQQEPKRFKITGKPAKQPGHPPTALLRVESVPHLREALNCLRELNPQASPSSIQLEG